MVVDRYSLGGAGGAGVDSTWDASHGPGGGGGGGGGNSAGSQQVGGAGGLYGGGGAGGGWSTGAGGNGAQGIIVVTYTSTGAGMTQARASILA